MQYFDFGKFGLAVILCGAVASCSTEPHQEIGKETAKELVAKCDFKTDPFVRDGTNDAALGTYYGTWDTFLKDLVIITRINGDKVETYSSHGTYYPLNVNVAECTKHHGTYTNGTIQLEPFDDGTKVTYTLIRDGLTGERVSSVGEVTKGQFSKVAVSVVSK